MEPTATHPLARFRVDLESVIEGHGVVHRAPASIWQDGLYLGNGDIAAMVFGEPGRTRILLNKGDIWDERAQDTPDQAEFWSWPEVKRSLVTALETGDWSEYREATRPRFQGARDGNFASFQPAGYLEILGDLPDEVTDFRQQLSIYRARVVSSFKHAGREMGFDVYTHATQNLLTIDIRSDDPTRWPLALRLHRNLEPFRQDWEGDPAMGGPAFGSEGDAMWMTMVFPDGFTYAAVLRTEGLELTAEEGPDGLTGHVGGDGRRDVRCHLTILTGQGGSPEELVRRGRRQLGRLASDARLAESHERWWADFWREGWISLPDKMIENLWYTELYKIASCSREGGQAPGQLGHWSGYPDPPWRGDYHTNVNVQETYWPIYTANRLDLGAPFYDMYLGMLDRVIEDTRRLTGLPGAKFSRGHGKSGRSNNPGSLNWGMWPGEGPWLSAHFWWHYQYTRDEDFLRRCYPMLRACVDFYVAYVGEPDAEGRYSVVPSLCHEQAHHQATAPEGRTWGRNSPYDLAILRELLRNTIAASEILGLDTEHRDKWRQVMANLAPYPVSDRGYLMEWEGIELSNSHRHLSHLYAIYPGEEIHQGSGPELVRTGRRSLARMVERGFEGFCGFSFPWLACIAARMGDAETAVEMVRNQVRAFVNVNGFSMIGDTKVPGLGDYCRGKGPDWEGRKLPNMESGSGLCAAISELLLCSPSGTDGSGPVVRVFPAVPAGWKEVRFSRLRAQGAFVVTAERRAGRTRYVLLESEAGAELRLANPWPGEAVAVGTADGKRVPHAVEAGNIVVRTERGRAYLVHPEGADPGDLELVEMGQEARDEHRLGIGGALDRAS